MTFSGPPDRARGFGKIPSCPIPVFLNAGDGRAVFYAPRFACVVPERRIPEVVRLVQALGVRDPDESLARDLPRHLRDAVAQLVRAAQSARDEAEDASRRPFAPECLTLFLNNSCNLQCRYCYSSPSNGASDFLSPEAVQAAARAVAESCTARNRPLTVAFHGGGEPTLNPDHLRQLLTIVQDVAREQNLKLQTYLATNGVLPEEQVYWLAQHIDRIGLSCDGPPRVQNFQRPARDGSPTSPAVERTASILHRSGKPFHVRVTLAAETLGEQAAIVEYLVARYAPEEIRLEPVYVNPSGTNGPARDHAALFAKGFLAARRVAAAGPTRVVTSLTRPAALYGRYCNALRHVVNLVPGDVATGCFLESREEDVERHQMNMGALDRKTGRFALDRERIDALIRCGSAIPEDCRDCLCAYQCTHGCPDFCAWPRSSRSARAGEGLRDSFRCHAHRLLMAELILEAADRAWGAAVPGSLRDSGDPESSLPVVVCKEPEGEG